MNSSWFASLLPVLTLATLAAHSLYGEPMQIDPERRALITREDQRVRFEPRIVEIVDEKRQILKTTDRERSSEGASFTEILSLQSESGQDGKMKLDVEGLESGFRFSFRWTDFEFKGLGEMALTFNGTPIDILGFEILDGPVKGTYSVRELKAGKPEPHIKPVTAFVLTGWAGKRLLVQLAAPEDMVFVTNLGDEVFEVRITHKGQPLRTGVIEGEGRFLRDGEEVSF